MSCGGEKEKEKLRGERWMAGGTLEQSSRAERGERRGGIRGGKAQWPDRQPTSWREKKKE